MDITVTAPVCRKRLPLGGAAGPAASASGPVLPGVASPLVDLDGAVQIRSRVTRSLTPGARRPVEVVDLPQADVVGPTSVLVHGIRISSALCVHDALAVGLVPAVLGAPGADGLCAGCSAARAGGTPARAVAAAGAAGRAGVYLDGRLVSALEDSGGEALGI